MPTAQLKYLGDLRIEAIHEQSRTKIHTDAPVDNKGKGESFSPTDLVATALGSCMLTIMGIKAQNLNVDLLGTTVAITKVMQASPRKINQVIVVFNIPNGHLFTDSQKATLEEAAHTCPVALSLDPAIEQKVSFNYL